MSICNLSHHFKHIWKAKHNLAGVEPRKMTRSVKHTTGFEIFKNSVSIQELNAIKFAWKGSLSVLKYWLALKTINLMKFDNLTLNKS